MFEADMVAFGDRRSPFKGTGMKANLVVDVFHKSALVGFEEEDVLIVATGGELDFFDALRFHERIFFFSFGVVFAGALDQYEPEFTGVSTSAVH